MSDEKLWKQIKEIVAASDDRHISETRKLYEAALLKGDMEQAHNLLLEMISKTLQDNTNLLDRNTNLLDRYDKYTGEIVASCDALIKFIQYKGLEAEFQQWAIQHKGLKAEFIQLVKKSTTKKRG